MRIAPGSSVAGAMIANSAGPSRPIALDARPVRRTMVPSRSIMISVSAGDGTSESVVATGVNATHEIAAWRRCASALISRARRTIPCML